MEGFEGGIDPFEVAGDAGAEGDQVRRLLGDKSLPRGVRVRLGLLLIYLASPIDLIPVLGYADDAIIVTAVLRGVVRRPGLDAVRGHDRHRDPTGHQQCE